MNPLRRIWRLISFTFRFVFCKVTPFQCHHLRRNLLCSVRGRNGNNDGKSSIRKPPGRMEKLPRTPEQNERMMDSVKSLVLRYSNRFIRICRNNCVTRRR